MKHPGHATKVIRGQFSLTALIDHLSWQLTKTDPVHKEAEITPTDLSITWFISNSRETINLGVDICYKEHSIFYTGEGFGFKLATGNLVRMVLRLPLRRVFILKFSQGHWPEQPVSVSPICIALTKPPSFKLTCFGSESDLIEVDFIIVHLYVIFKS